MSLERVQMCLDEHAAQELDLFVPITSSIQDSGFSPSLSDLLLPLLHSLMPSFLSPLFSTPLSPSFLLGCLIVPQSVLLLSLPKSFMPPFFFLTDWPFCCSSLSFCVRFLPVPCLTTLGKLVDLVHPARTHNDLQTVVQATTDAASPIQSFQRIERNKIEGVQAEWLSL